MKQGYILFLKKLNSNSNKKHWHLFCEIIIPPWVHSSIYTRSFTAYFYDLDVTFALALIMKTNEYTS